MKFVRVHEVDGKDEVEIIEADSIEETEKNLNELVFASITSDFKNVGPFYLHASKYIINGIIRYIRQIYDQEITKEIVIQEILYLFPYLNKNNISGALFWGEIKNVTEFNCIAIDVLNDKTINDVFSYISSAIISAVVAGTVIEDKSFIPKIP